MGYALDIVLIIILGASIFSAYRRGFVKTVLSALGFFIALVVAFSFRAQLSEYVMRMPFVDSIRETVREEFIQMAPTSNSELGEVEYDVDKLVNEKPENFENLLKIAGIDYDELISQLDSWKVEGEQKTADMLVEYIANPLIEGAVNVLSFIALFVVSLLIIKVLISILDNVFRLPVLKQANKALGLAVGVLLGLFRAYVFGAVITFLFPLVQSENPTLTLGESFVFKYFYGPANILIEFFS